MAKDEIKGTGLWKHMEVLTADTRDDWFDTLNQILIGEDVLFLQEKTMKEYSTIREEKRKVELGNEWIVEGLDKDKI